MDKSFKSWYHLRETKTGNAESGFDQYNKKDQHIIRKMLDLTRLRERRGFANNTNNISPNITQSIDINDMIDYWDNQLPPERTKIIERNAFLNSDFLDELIQVGETIAQERGVLGHVAWLSEYR